LNSDSTDPWAAFDRIYCISLAGRNDRREQARAEFHRVGLGDRVEFKIVEKHPTNSEQGIFESHLQCLRDGLAAGAKRIVVFEDDVVFRRFSPARLQDAVKFLESTADWRFFFLGCFVSSSRKTSCASVLKVRYRCLAHAYAVNRHVAEELVGLRSEIGGVFSTPSPCTQGEGRGGGSLRVNEIGDLSPVANSHPHPNPPPEYRERGQEIAWQTISAATLWRGVPYDMLLKEKCGDGAYAIYPAIAFQSNAATDNDNLRSLDRTRRLLGGLGRLQRWNEFSHRRFVPLVVAHAIIVILLVLLVLHYYRVTGR
jgi:GR25 family glycosyltransferase involved in LPS biosynthesis